MKSILATVIALGLAVFSVFAQSPPTIITPSSPVACDVLLLSWTNNGLSPWIVSVLSMDLSTTLFAFNATTDTMVSWLVDIAQGTSIVFKVTDKAGQFGQSGVVTIQPNLANTNSCVGSTSYSFFGTAPVSGATGTAQSPSGATTTSSLTGNTATTNSGSAATPGSSAGTTATSSSSTTSQSAGASRVTGQIAIAGIIGALMVALLG